MNRGKAAAGSAAALPYCIGNCVPYATNATEAVQIVGRFRNGVEDAAHIFSTNKEMPCKSREEIATRLEECEAVYKQWSDAVRRCNST